MDGLLERLEALPIAALYLALSGIAAIENIFPPIPADTVVAFGAFLAARGQGTATGAFLATWMGNVAGAMLMYGLGRHFGADWLHERVTRRGGSHDMQARLEKMYGKYGLAAIFMSRFLPGVRALVPPFAGALRVPPVRAGIMIGVASAIWYGAITYAAYNLGANWEVAVEKIGGVQRALGIAFGVIALVALTVWLVRRRRR